MNPKKQKSVSKSLQPAQSLPNQYEKKYGSRPLTVQIRFCGGCNPDIDRGDAVNRLKDMAESRHIAIRFTDAPKAADLSILINGCPHACLEEEINNKNSFSYITVQGENIDCHPVAESRIAQVIFEKILKKIPDVKSPQLIAGSDAGLRQIT